MCHTKVKRHAKAFWAELSRHLPNWKELNEQLAGIGCKKIQ
ncbi:YgjP-like metallopeptidase domain-containing protein [Spirosoma jeollabukense]